MKIFFSKLFNIRVEEWPRVFLLLLIAILTNVAAIWGTTIAYAAFLQYLGVTALPWILVLSSLLSVFVVAVYTAFADSTANDTLLLVLYAIGAFCILCGMGLLWIGFSRQAYPLLYLCDLVWVVVFNSHFTTYVNSFYDIQSAKRVLPTVFAGFRAGAILGGLTMPVLTYRATPGVILMIWFLTYLVIIALLRGMPILRHEHATRAPLPYASPVASEHSSRKSRLSSLTNIKEGFQYTMGSVYLRWMAVGAFFLVILISLIEYRSSEILLGIYGSSEELASFLALLIGLGNMFVLPMLLFGISRIVAWLGVGNASLLFPAGNLLISGGLMFFPGFISAAIAYLDRKAFRPAFQLPMNSLLYNAIPLRVKGRARAFVDGLITPFGTLIGGLLLMLPFVSQVSWFVPALIGSVACIYMGSALVIRRQYGQALVSLLKQEDYAFLLSQEASDLTVADPATLKLLQEKLIHSNSRELTIFMAQLLSQIGGKQALPLLEHEARSTTDPLIRAAILNILVATDLRSLLVRRLYLDFLHDPDGQVRQAAMNGLVRIFQAKDPELLSNMLEMVHDPEFEVCAQALSVLAGTEGFFQFTPAVDMLNRLLESPEPQQRVYGIRVLKHLGAHQAFDRLAHFLTDQSDEVRLEAIVAFEEFSDLRKLSEKMATGGRSDGDLSPSTVTETQPKTELSVIIATIQTLLHDPVERVRQAALTILGALGDRPSRAAIIQALKDPSPLIRTTASNVLLQTGKSLIPLLHAQLNGGDPLLHKMASVTLTRIDPKEFGGLINTNITGNLLNIYQQYGVIEALNPYARYSGIVMLQKALQEQNQQLLNEIFYFLTALYDIHSVRIIHESLRSEHAYIRANAAEALETMTTPQISRLIVPLFEPNVSGAHLLSLSQQTWELECHNAEIAFKHFLIHPDDNLLRTIATFALGQMGARFITRPEQAPVTHEVEKHEPPRSASSERGGIRRNRQAAQAVLGDFLNVLTDAPDKTTSEEPNQKQAPFSFSEIETLLAAALTDSDNDVRLAAQAAKRIMTGFQFSDMFGKEEFVLSLIEKMIFLKEVPFFQGMTIEQLKVLANVCEEEFFPADTRVFRQGEPGGTLYVIVTGRVGIEQERRKGSFVRVNTLEAYSYLGEVSVFDASPHTADAITVQDTLTLRISREPLLALARQHPELSLQLINALNRQLRQAYNRIADLSRSRPRELHKLFDQFD
ncbi:MAG: HEAT repeat domain-containing protein [Candidatus Vecturithrix sp.]|jgi:HEAT repeat protein|nr:HEAT repeat domain-containing protein [Candidatus Vecturithrix sp.]